MKVCPKCGKQYGDDANFCTGDAGRLVAMAAATPATPAAAPTPAANLIGGRFELGERIGGGLTGEIHRATDRQGGGVVALKLIDPAITATPANAQRIERECKLLERVTSAAMAKVVASGKHGEQLWVASEWIDGAQPLGAHIASGAIAPDRASSIVAQVGAAVLEAAKLGVVHRDLSPKNILVAGDTVKVINFALPMPGGKVAGVPGYVPPEAIEGKPIDQRSATYSLGAVFYAALTGAPPFGGDVAAIESAQLGTTIPPPSTRVPLPPEFDAVIGRAMDRNPAKRHLTLKQFLDDVDRVAKGGEVSPSSTAPFGRVGKPKELASTMLGVGSISEGGAETKTRQMDIQIPPEALRDIAAASAAVAAAPAPSPAVMAPAPVVAAAPVAPSQPIPQPVADPSPWAAPPAAAPGPMTPAVQAIAQAAPQLGAAASAPASSPQSPTVPLPAAVPSAPVVPAASSMSGKDKGGKKKPDGGGKKKGQFRETLWFKKGDLDAAAAEEAARTGDAAAQDKADMLPMEDRYKDDGTLTSTDAERYSLRTGQTSSMPVMRDAGPGASSSVSERDLIGEMKGGRTKIFVAIGVAAVALVVIIAAFAL